MILYTTAGAACELRVAIPTIKTHAKKLGLTRQGRDWIFSLADLESLRQSMAERRPGRPTKRSQAGR